MSKTPSEELYYYADGARVPLDRADDYLAVDAQSLDAADLSSGARTEVRKIAEPLRGDMMLVSKAKLGAKLGKEVEEHCLTQPVYRHEDTLLVALPEVRVEVAENKPIKSIETWLGNHAVASAIIKKVPSGLVLRPKSGSGKDALQLANQLHEGIHPEMAQVRFIRIVPKQ